MIRICLPCFLFASLTACQPTMETVQRSALEYGAPCDATLPAPKSWDGGPIPLPQTDANAIYLYDSPNGDGHTWAIAVDGYQIVTTVDLKPEAVAAFVGMNFAPTPKATARTVVCKAQGYATVTTSPRGTTCEHPPYGAFVAEGRIASFLEDLTTAMTDTLSSVADSYAQQLVCPEPINS